jgi:hypothetical protein
MVKEAAGLTAQSPIQAQIEMGYIYTASTAKPHQRQMATTVFFLT